MSAYSIVNLKEEVEDSMGERAPGIEVRFARNHLDSEHLGISDVDGVTARWRTRPVLRKLACQLW